MNAGSLSTRILIGLVCGLAIGIGLATVHAPWRDQVVSAADALGGLWLDALRMTIIPLVFSLVVIGIAQASDAAHAGRLAARALGAFAVLLVVSAAIGALATPALLAAWPPPAAAEAALRSLTRDASGLPPATPFAEWLGSFIPTNLVKAAADGSMAAIVVFALLFGLAAAAQAEPRRLALFGFFDAVQAAMMTLVGWILQAGPFGVFLLALAVGAKTGASAVGLLGQYVVVVSIMCLAAGSVGLLLGLVGGRIAPRRMLAALTPVEAMAVSTQSSLASLPVMLRATTELGAPERVRDLVLPMAVALFRITSPAGNVAVAVYAAHVYGVALDPARLVAGAMVAALVSLAAVGVASSVTFFTTLILI
ncbi:MAG TPA: cation:dicarboxylase symporter family transporter, partial [Caulobacteraceae bacterium]|nr:cation:dicarboxylase symporter family transporter [Caulobacteraceae bacterium]